MSVQSSLRAAAAAVAVTLVATLSPVGLTQAADAGPPLLPGVSQDKPIRLTASRTPIRDVSSRVWQPDAPYARGGRLVGSLHQVAGTANPTLYQHARLGVTDYAINVNGPATYFVNLFTAELRGARPNHRVWNVTAEGHKVATDVDVSQAAGYDRAWHVMFPVIVTDGTLNIHLTRRVGTPVVGAVEVDYQSANLVKSTLFHDNFSGQGGTRPNPARWGYDTGGDGWGNNEQETYTAQKTNVSLDGNGHLVIAARHETFKGRDGITRNYTSGRIKTLHRFSFQYGRAVARINVPRGQGLWPAFWALGDNVGTVGWPLCGEIDVMEHLGSQPRVVHASVRAGRQSGGGWLAGRPWRWHSALTTAFHEYGLVWGPSGIAMSLDGRTYMTVAAADLPPEDLWNFNHSFYLLLNLAVGGNWPGAPNEKTQFPAYMVVDDVRVTG